MGRTAWHRVVAGVLVRPGGILMAHRHPDRGWYPDVWDFPGGHVEDGESDEECLVRELGEELGVRAHGPMPTLAHWVIEGAGEDIRFLLVRDWSGEVRNLAPDEHDELRWVSVEEAVELDLADPAYPDLLRSLPDVLGVRGSPSRP